MPQLGKKERKLALIEINQIIWKVNVNRKKTKKNLQYSFSIPQSMHNYIKNDLNDFPYSIIEKLNYCRSIITNYQKIDEAIAILISLITDSSAKDEILLHLGVYTRIKEDERRNILAKGEIDLNYSRLHHRLLLSITNIEKNLYEICRTN
jgi:hypothetical protein